MKSKNYIITFHRAHNYGAFLQAYALQTSLKKMKYETYIVDYRNTNIEKGYKILNIRTKNPTILIKRIITACKHYKELKGRKELFEEVIKNELILTQSVKKIEDIEKIVDKKDNIIVGSDQVWNLNITHGFDKIYYLIGSIKCKKISYAASIGDISLIKNNKAKYKDNLSKLNNISVREEDAKKELEKLLNRNVETVLDPTLLLTQGDWNQKISNCKVPTEKYILAYVVKKDDEYIKIVNELSDRTGLKVIHFGLKNPGYKNVLKSEYTCGPWEFINLIKNAEYVVATSFHATAFSIIFNKRFFIVPHRKTGTRVTSLLDKLGIKNRSFNSLDEFKKIDYNFETNWEQVNKKLEKEREKSINWLINAIEK